MTRRSPRASPRSSPRSRSPRAAKHWKLPYLFEHGNSYADGAGAERQPLRAVPAPLRAAAAGPGPGRHGRRRRGPRPRGLQRPGDPLPEEQQVGVRQAAGGRVQAPGRRGRRLHRRAGELRTEGLDTQEFAKAQAGSDSQWSDVVTQSAEVGGQDRRGPRRGQGPARVRPTRPAPRSVSRRLAGPPRRRGPGSMPPGPHSTPRPVRRHGDSEALGRGRLRRGRGANPSDGRSQLERRSITRPGPPPASRQGTSSGDMEGRGAAPGPRPGAALRKASRFLEVQRARGWVTTVTP